MSAKRGTAYLPFLDGWRGIAVGLLLLGHFFPVPGINFGTVGVHLFFVLSGFLMTRILFVQKVPLKQFYQRRIARVFPSVYVFLTTVTLIFIVSGRDVSLVELLTAATFTNNYLLPPGQWTMPFGHIWSLSVEEHAYVVLSVAAVLSRSTPGRSVRALALLTGATVLAILLYALVLDSKAVTRAWGHSEVAAFGIFASGLLFLCLAQGPGARPRPWMVAALLVVGLGAHWWSVPAAVRLLVGCGAFALALNWLAATPGILRRALEFAPLRWLGACSFSLYLWQQPFYQLVRHAGLDPALGLALSLATGVLAFYTIEQPARRYLNARWSQPVAAPTQPRDDKDDQLQQS